MKDYAEAIPEESREEYNQLVSKVFGDDHDAMQQAVMDIVKMILPKYMCLFEKSVWWWREYDWRGWNERDIVGNE